MTDASADPTPPDELPDNIVSDLNQLAPEVCTTWKNRRRRRAIGKRSGRSSGKCTPTKS